MAGPADIEDIIEEVEKALSDADLGASDSPLVQYLTAEGADGEDDINEVWKIDPNAPMGSGKVDGGRISSIFRKVFRRLSKNYIDPLVQRINVFHAASVKSQNRTNERLEFIERRLKEQPDKLAEISRILKDKALEARFDKMERKVSAVNWRAKNDTLRWSSKKTIKEVLDIDYLEFENIHRGEEAVIKERQSSVVRFFAGKSNVLDIGCGRGEFLEIMKERNISAKGIDLDEKMVDLCKSKGLTVKRENALTFLKSVEKNSLGGIFMGQVVEHLTAYELIELTDLCYDRLKKGSYIVIETINPLCLFAMANFYLDISHQKPIHPDFLRFHLKSLGLHSTELEFISPVGEGKRLSLLKETDGKDGSSIADINENFKKLNDLLFSCRDYIIAAKK